MTFKNLYVHIFEDRFAHIEQRRKKNKLSRDEEKKRGID